MAEPVSAGPVAVATAWARSLGLTAGPSLPPTDENTGTPLWAPAFVTTGLVVGGFPDLNLPRRNAVVQFSSYAVTPNSLKPAFGRAESNAMQLENAVNAEPPVLTLGAGYKPVWLSHLIVRLHTRWFPEPDTDWARYDVDIEIGFIEREPA
jgi:hypothetical protein